MSEGDEGSVQIPLAWVGAEDVSIEFANQIIIQHQGDEFVLTIGQMVGPALIGENARDIAEKIDYVPIRVLARLGLTEGRMREFVNAMQANLDNFERKRDTLDPRNDHGS
jgi:hypothetical protein